jgi:hypothetical protein
MKLYWRIKINKKWTWRPAKVTNETAGKITVEKLENPADNP